MSWRILTPKDIPLIRDFLLLNEKIGIQVIDLILKNGVITFPETRDVIILIDEKFSLIHSIIVLTSRGLVYPIFSLDYISTSDKNKKKSLESLIKNVNFPLHGAIGLQRNVKIYNDLITKGIKQVNSYVLLSREIESPVLDGNNSHIVLATENDLKKLAPLEFSYQKEEVIISIADFNKNAIIKNLKNKINKYNYYYFESQNQALSKGCITHRSFNYVLLGGIFTAYDYRNQGLATKMVSFIVNDQLKNGYKSALFVKKENSIAQRVYSKLNFKFPLDYSIYYYK
jgi:predicted GNAT family acetyltransferase